MGHREVRRFAWLPALLRQAFLKDPALGDAINNDASTDQRPPPTTIKEALMADPNNVTDTSEYTLPEVTYDPVLGKADMKASLFTPVETANSNMYYGKATNTEDHATINEYAVPSMKYDTVLGKADLQATAAMTVATADSDVYPSKAGTKAADRTAHDNAVIASTATGKYALVNEKHDTSGDTNYVHADRAAQLLKQVPRQAALMTEYRVPLSDFESMFAGFRYNQDTPDKEDKANDSSLQTMIRTNANHVRNIKYAKLAPRYATQLHHAQKWATLLNSGAEPCSPPKVILWNKTRQHPTPATAVRSATPR